MLPIVAEGLVIRNVCGKLMPKGLSNDRKTSDTSPRVPGQTQSANAAPAPIDLTSLHQISFGFLVLR